MEVGNSDGSAEGTKVGVSVGGWDGLNVFRFNHASASEDGETVGTAVGTNVGGAVGGTDGGGGLVGTIVGKVVGRPEGGKVGIADGASVGRIVQCLLIQQSS